MCGFYLLQPSSQMYVPTLSKPSFAASTSAPGVPATSASAPSTAAAPIVPQITPAMLATLTSSSPAKSLEEQKTLLEQLTLRVEEQKRLIERQKAEVEKHKQAEEDKGAKKVPKKAEPLPEPKIIPLERGSAVGKEEIPQETSSVRNLALERLQNKTKESEETLEAAKPVATLTPALQSLLSGQSFENLKNIVASVGGSQVGRKEPETQSLATTTSEVAIEPSTKTSATSAFNLHGDVDYRKMPKDYNPMVGPFAMDEAAPSIPGLGDLEEVNKIKKEMVTQVPPRLPTPPVPPMQPPPIPEILRTLTSGDGPKLPLPGLPPPPTPPVAPKLPSNLTPEMLRIMQGETVTSVLHDKQNNEKPADEGKNAGPEPQAVPQVEEAAYRGDWRGEGNMAEGWEERDPRFEREAWPGRERRAERWDERERRDDRERLEERRDDRWPERRDRRGTLDDKREYIQRKRDEAYGVRGSRGRGGARWMRGGRRIGRSHSRSRERRRSLSPSDRTRRRSRSRSRDRLRRRSRSRERTRHGGRSRSRSRDRSRQQDRTRERSQRKDDKRGRSRERSTASESSQRAAGSKAADKQEGEKVEENKAQKAGEAKDSKGDQAETKGQEVKSQLSESKGGTQAGSEVPKNSQLTTVAVSSSGEKSKGSKIPNSSNQVDFEASRSQGANSRVPKKRPGSPVTRSDATGSKQAKNDSQKDSSASSKSAAAAKVSDASSHLQPPQPKSEGDKQPGQPVKKGLLDTPPRMAPSAPQNTGPGPIPRPTMSQNAPPRGWPSGDVLPQPPGMPPEGPRGNWMPRRGRGIGPRPPMGGYPGPDHVPHGPHPDQGMWMGPRPPLGGPPGPEIPGRGPGGPMRMGPQPPMGGPPGPENRASGREQMEERPEMSPNGEKTEGRRQSRWDTPSVAMDERPTNEHQDVDHRREGMRRPNDHGFPERNNPSDNQGSTGPSPRFQSREPPRHLREGPGNSSPFHGPQDDQPPKKPMGLLGHYPGEARDLDMRTHGPNDPRRPPEAGHPDFKKEGEMSPRFGAHDHDLRYDVYQEKEEFYAENESYFPEDEDMYPEFEEYPDEDLMMEEPFHGFRGRPPHRARGPPRGNFADRPRRGKPFGRPPFRGMRRPMRGAFPRGWSRGGAPRGEPRGRGRGHPP